jgi:hypothetical protein
MSINHLINTDMKNFDFSKIDFTDLRTQKGVLLVIIDELEKKEDIRFEELNGILHLIDSIQDYAVDVLGVPEMMVYDLDVEENREASTPEENFARESAERIFGELCESDGFHQDDEVPSIFIEEMMTNKMHEAVIKSNIREQILLDLKAHPVLFDISETTKELQYDGDMREDYEGLVTNYIRKQFARKQEDDI